MRLCRKYGHVLDDLTTLTQVKRHPNGRWYTMRSCRVCRAIKISLRWYGGLTLNKGKYRYRGPPISEEEIVLAVEERWRVRREKWQARDDNLASPGVRGSAGNGGVDQNDKHNAGERVG